jgi:hypothetical protein
VRVKFTLQRELPFGQSLKLVGSHAALGSWDEERGPSMTWKDGHVWMAEVPLPAGTAVEFKVRAASKRPADDCSSRMAAAGKNGGHACLLGSSLEKQQIRS